MTRPREIHVGKRGAWERAAREAADARDEATRASRPAAPSTSTVPQRCSGCGHWGTAGRWTCAACGLPWEPAPLRGLDSVR